MLIKVKNGDRTEVLFVNEANFKKRTLKHLSLSPVDRTLNRVTSKIQYNLGQYSLYAVANGGVASGFVLAGGLPSVLLFLTLGIMGAGGAGMTYSLRYGKRAGKRHVKALQQTVVDRDQAVRIDVYSHNALNSYAFNALMKTDFGKSVLSKELFVHDYVDNVNALGLVLAVPKDGPFHEILLPQLHSYLAETSFADKELERLAKEQPDVVPEAKKHMDAFAQAWVVENMETPYRDYEAEQAVVAETEREMTLDYFKGLLPGTDSWGD